MALVPVGFSAPHEHVDVGLGVPDEPADASAGDVALRRELTHEASGDAQGPGDLLRCEQGAWCDIVRNVDGQGHVVHGYTANRWA